MFLLNKKMRQHFFIRSRGDSGFQSLTSCQRLPPPPPRCRRIRPFGSFAERKDLLHRHSAVRRHPAPTFFKARLCLGIFEGTLRFESLNLPLNYNLFTSLICPLINKPTERGGFEPPVSLRTQRFSRPPDSTALASLRLWELFVFATIILFSIELIHCNLWKRFMSRGRILTAYTSLSLPL